MSNDKQLQQSVIDALAWEASLASAHIGVTATDGVITLSGHVPSYWEKRSAQATARQVKGVKAIADEIEVKLLSINAWEDDEIARLALQNLASDSVVPKDAITLTVDRGWVTLRGEVEWHFQKTAAEHVVHRLLGVVGVVSDINVKPHVQAYEVREKIEDALRRQSSIDASGISIETKDGKVTLGGSVKNLFERDLVERAAWSVPGVAQVEDKIALTW